MRTVLQALRNYTVPSLRKASYGALAIMLVSGKVVPVLFLVVLGVFLTLAVRYIRP